MKNEDVKVIVRALCIMSLTLFINLVFVHLIVYASPAMEIEAFDAAGHEVIFNDGGYAVNAGPVRFVFNEDSLYGEGMYLYDDMDGGMLNPVKDGEYVLYPGENSGTVSFYRKYSDNEARLLYTYHVRFVDGIFDKPEASLMECREGVKLTVLPLRRSHVFCSIKGRKNGDFQEPDKISGRILAGYGIGGVRSESDNNEPLSEEIGDETEFLLAEDDVYDIALYSEDGLGHRTYADIPSEIVLDRKGPEISAGSAEITGDRLSLMLGAKDEITGISFVTIKDGDRRLYSGSGEKEKVNIDISGLPCGIRKYSIRASDKAGNVSEEYFTVEKKDLMPPELKLEGASDKGVYGREVRIRLLAEDGEGDECTIKETVKSYGLSGELIEEETRTEDSLTFDKSGIYIITAEASDSAGNTARDSLAFAIDREAPVITGLLGLDGSRLKSFMLRNTETIASDDSMVQVRVLLNGMDYNGARVTKSGRYRLQVLAADEFGNTAEKDASFEVRPVGF